MDGAWWHDTSLVTLPKDECHYTLTHTEFLDVNVNVNVPEQK